METIWEKTNALFVGGLWAALLVSAFVVVLSVVSIKLLRRTMTRLSTNARFDGASLAFSRRVINAVIIIVAALIISMQIVPLKGLSTSLLASSGIVAVILGVAAQQSTANFVSGFFLSIFRPFTIGDRIRLIGPEVVGFVEDISLRHTVLRNYDNNRIIVPNSVMSTAIVENARYQDDKSARGLEIRIDANADVERAMEIIAQEVQAHPSFHDNRTEQQVADGVPPVVVRLTKYDETAAVLNTVLWGQDEGTSFVMRSDLLLTIRRRFIEAGISLPVLRHAVVEETAGTKQR